ncbi:hypothetical protein [Nostoc sp.]
MKTTAKELAMPAALGILVLTTSCTATSNPSVQTQQSEKVTQVRDSAKVATTIIVIDGSSTVYPITQAIAKDYQADPKAEMKLTIGELLRKEGQF